MAQETTTDWIEAGTLRELARSGVMVVRGRKTPIAVFAVGDSVFAVDNRCPHMGFPLDKGTVKDGLLTCHWHQARFDLCSGCTFDLWADDIPAFDTRIEEGKVFVSSAPRREPDRGYHLQRLEEGLQRNIGLVQAKSLLGLLDDSTDAAAILAHVARYASQNRDDWRSGLTILAILGNLRDYLSAETLYYGLTRGVREVGGETSGEPPRRPRSALEWDRYDKATLAHWLSHWVLSRHRDGAERTVLTALKMGLTWQDLNDLVFTAASDRMYANQGHLFDFCNKAFELIEIVGRQEAAGFLPLLMSQLAEARGGEESAHWHHPLEIVEPLREAQKRLPSIIDMSPSKTNQNPHAIREALLGEDPLAIISELSRALEQGFPPQSLSREVAFVAATRLARFATSNEVGDWFNPQHTFTYANAVHQAVKRSPTAGVVRAIYHGAISVYMDRFLNVPPRSLPGERGSLDGLPPGADELLELLLDSLNHREEDDLAAQSAVRYFRLGHPFAKLVDTLFYATVREDLDFHPLQVLESGVQLIEDYGNGPEAEVILTGIVRQLAALCPTRRAGLQTAAIALRLHQGQEVFA